MALRVPATRMGAIIKTERAVTRTPHYAWPASSAPARNSGSTSRPCTTSPKPGRKPAQQSRATSGPTPLSEPAKSEENGSRIAIEPVREPVFDLNDMLNKMTPAAFHDEIEFGPPLGHEIW